jgi:hypothetical protein
MLQPVSWLVLATIHALPAMALFRPSVIERLYGVSPGDPAFLLLQHRAALFMVVLILAVWAAFDPGIRRAASLCVGTSMISFLLLYWAAGAPPSLKGIAIADLAGIPFLALVAWKSFAA